MELATNLMFSYSFGMRIMNNITTKSTKFFNLNIIFNLHVALKKILFLFIIFLSYVKFLNANSVLLKTLLYYSLLHGIILNLN